MDANQFIILVNHMFDMIKKLEKRIEQLEKIDGGKF